jgi:hypothetical protein
MILLVVKETCFRIMPEKNTREPKYSEDQLQFAWRGDYHFKGFKGL